MAMTKLNKSYSFICVYNNEEQLERMLLPSLKNINAIPIKSRSPNDYLSYLLIDNISHRYKSAAEAYNNEIKKNCDLLGDILIFSHQDIAFDDGNFLNTFDKVFSNRGDVILGMAGVASDGLVYSNLRYYYTNSYIIPLQSGWNGIKQVVSVDECLFAINKSLFLKLWFDEQTCFHWHLYAVDLCYSAMSHYDAKSYVIPDKLYHKEYGPGGLTTDLLFLRTIWRLANKYRKEYKRIYSPCCRTKTSLFPLSMTIAKYLMALFCSKIKHIFQH